MIVINPNSFHARRRREASTGDVSGPSCAAQYPPSAEGLRHSAASAQKVKASASVPLAAVAQRKKKSRWEERVRLPRRRLARHRGQTARIVSGTRSAVRGATLVTGNLHG